MHTGVRIPAGFPKIASAVIRTCTPKFIDYVEIIEKVFTKAAEVASWSRAACFFVIRFTVYSF